MAAKFNTYDEKYAMVRMCIEHGYGHMTAHIYNLIPGWGCKPTLKVQSQIGGEHEGSCSKPYAWKWGVAHDFDVLTANEVAAFAKVTGAIDRKLAKMDAELGYPASYSEFMARVLIASGISHVFINPAWGGAYDTIDHVPRCDIKTGRGRGQMRERLARVERDLIAYFAKKVTA